MFKKLFFLIVVMALLAGCAGYGVANTQDQAASAASGSSKSPAAYPVPSQQTWIVPSLPFSLCPLLRQHGIYCI